MSNYLEESTCDFSNPFNQQRSLAKQKLIDQAPLTFNQDNSQTIPFHKQSQKTQDETIKPGKLPKKIKTPITQHLNTFKQPTPNHKQSSEIEQDTSNTKTHKNNNKNKSQPNKNLLFLTDPTTNNKITNLPLAPKNKLIPEPSPQVQSILSGPKMREKYGNLLPKAHQKSISFDQQHLLKIFSMMDETIQFSNKNRAMKFIFFEELKRIIRDSLKVFIQIKHLEQLLYLDESLFEVKWEMSYEKRGFDIMICLPKIKSKQQRKTKIRQIMVDYLNEKHKQFLISKGLQINQVDGPWHYEFQPARYEIPRKTIGAHPETRDAELRCFDQNKIEDIKNTKLKQLIQNKKQQSEVQSFKSKSVMDMIFSGVGSKNIQSQLMKAVKEKQQNTRKNKIIEEESIQKQKNEIQPEILKEISQTVLWIYMSKTMTNIFKVKLIEQVKERTNHKFGNYIVDRHIEHLIELREIGYLKEIIQGKNKPIIVQINKAKAKQIITYADSLKQKLKQQQINSNQTVGGQIII